MTWTWRRQSFAAHITGRPCPGLGNAIGLEYRRALFARVRAHSLVTAHVSAYPVMSHLDFAEPPVNLSTTVVSNTLFISPGTETAIVRRLVLD